MLYGLTFQSGMRLAFKAGHKLINLHPPWFHRRSIQKYAGCVPENIWVSWVHHICANSFLCAFCEHVSLSNACMQVHVCWVSSSWEYIIAEELSARWEASRLRGKWKQDVAAPHSFEGVPHHTSESVEGRSMTIKGHSVYLNLPASARQMFPMFFSFISSHKPYFLFLQRSSFSFLFVLMGKKKSQLSFTPEGG